MIRRISLARAFALATGLSIAAGACLADKPQDFRWIAPIQLPAGASMARVQVPGAALTQLQGSDARDLRVFNATGEVVPFAYTDGAGPAVPPPVVKTASYPALPLYSGAPSARPAKGSMQVRIADGRADRSVWVRIDGAEAPADARINSVLFATKDEKQSLGAIEVQAALPANTPVWMTASSSADLSQWTPLPLRGRLYRFEGAGAPVNMTLEFDRPVQLEGRYLRLDWNGQQGVSVSGVMGVVATHSQAPQRERVDLPPLQPAGANAMEVETGFATPLAGLALSTGRANTLLPVRVLGRNEAGQPWYTIGQTVVYRLGPEGSEAVNPPLAMRGASVRWLRIESTNNSDLGVVQLKAAAEFEPLRLVFVASGAPPFQLAAGRAGTTLAALPWPTIAPTLGSRKLDELPLAPLGPATMQAGDMGPLAQLWPGGGAPGKATVLWAVLLIGVLLLAGVAWSLLRQLKAAPTSPPAPTPPPPTA